ncbi:MAG TPA: hypothetical protein VK308_09875 [Pyrinomonadaceae bacterium]|nr:hypothetical protein [Pyrinomonadaceae bacterium]
MENKLEVSFNSPQCGWMSVGFANDTSEFHTTTAYTPHSQALPEILKGLSSLLEAQNGSDEFVIAWSRNPEAYDFLFKRAGEAVRFEVIEYPTFDRRENEGEMVFSHEGDAKNVCEAFYATFAQLYEDKDTDEFEFNWRQSFPFAEYEKFENLLKSYGK